MSRKQKIFGILIFCLVVSGGFWGVFKRTDGSSFGASASVPENPLNRIFKRLREREVVITEKEKNLALREETLQKEQIPSKIPVILASGALLFIVLNFYFDYRHRKIKNF